MFHYLRVEAVYLYLLDPPYGVPFIGCETFEITWSYNSLQVDLRSFKPLCFLSPIANLPYTCITVCKSQIPYMTEISLRDSFNHLVPECKQSLQEQKVKW